MKRFPLFVAPLALIALSACNEQTNSTPSVSKAPAAKVVGEAEDCIPIVSISSTAVHDDRTIDFKAGSRIYRNTLPYSCPQLGLEQAFTYETSLSRLCSTDIIYVLHNYGGSLNRGAGCGLGKFVPVELEKKRN